MTEAAHTDLSNFSHDFVGVSRRRGFHTPCKAKGSRLDLIVVDGTAGRNFKLNKNDQLADNNSVVSGETCVVQGCSG